MHDLVISGGSVVDGFGQPGRTADVVIQNGQIVGIVRLGKGVFEFNLDNTDVDAGGMLYVPVSNYVEGDLPGGLVRGGRISLERGRP